MYGDVTLGCVSSWVGGIIIYRDRKTEEITGSGKKLMTFVFTLYLLCLNLNGDIKYITEYESRDRDLFWVY